MNFNCSRVNHGVTATVRRYPVNRALQTEYTDMFASLGRNRKSYPDCEISTPLFYWFCSPLYCYISLFCCFHFSLLFSSAFLLPFNGWLWLIEGSLGIYGEVIFFCFIFFFNTNCMNASEKKKCVFVVLIKCSLLKIGPLDVRRGNYVSWFVLVGR